MFAEQFIRFGQLEDHAKASLVNGPAGVFEKPETVKWICRKCGYVHEGTKALKVCPACQHPQAYQEVYAENF